MSTSALETQVGATKAVDSLEELKQADLHVTYGVRGIANIDWSAVPQRDPREHTQDDDIAADRILADQDTLLANFTKLARASGDQAEPPTAICIDSLVSGMPDEDTARIIELLKDCDDDGEGRISFEEFWHHFNATTTHHLRDCLGGVENQQPIWVDMRFVIREIANIDTVEGTADVNVHVYLYWTDPRLIDYDEAALPDKLWGPEVDLSNTDPKSSMKVIQDEFSLIDSKAGRLRRMFKCEGTIMNTMMNLNDFPYDADDVHVLFTTMSRWSTYDQTLHGKCPAGRTYRLRKVGKPGPSGELRVEGKWIRLDKLHSIAEWTLRGISYRLVEKEPNDAGLESTNVHLSFHVTRNAGFYWWKVLAPLYMSFVLSLQVFNFDPLDMSDRVATTAVYMLANLYVWNQDLYARLA